MGSYRRCAPIGEPSGRRHARMQTGRYRFDHPKPQRLALAMSTIHQTYPALASLERSPFSAILGLKVETASVGVAVVRMPFDLRLLNDGGPDVPIHGGAIASLAHFPACAAVSTMAENRRSATISMTGNYPPPALQ